MKPLFRRLSLAALLASALVAPAAAADITLLNVSYDPTRELYVALNKAFGDAYKGETGKSVEIKQRTFPSRPPMAALASRPAR